MLDRQPRGTAPFGRNRWPDGENGLLNPSTASRETAGNDHPAAGPREKTLLELGSSTGFRGYFGFSRTTGMLQRSIMVNELFSLLPYTEILAIPIPSLISIFVP
jgi:hypothetical protein